MNSTNVDPDRQHLVKTSKQFGVPALLTLALGIVLIALVPPLAILGIILIVCGLFVLGCIGTIWLLHSQPEPTTQ